MTVLRVVPGPAQRVCLPGPTEPMAVARRLVDAQHKHPSGARLLRSWRGGWWQWHRSHWAELEERSVRNAAYGFTEKADYLKKDAKGNESLTPWDPNRHRIADLLEALAAVCFLHETANQPTWIGGDDPGGPIVACANGLLHLESRTLLPHTPSFFNQTSVPFAYDADGARAGQVADLPRRAVGRRQRLDRRAAGVVRLRDLRPHSTCTRSCCSSARRVAARASIARIARRARRHATTSPARRCPAWAATSAWRRCSASRWP